MNKILFIIGLFIALLNLITIVLCEVFLKTNIKKFPSSNSINERKWLKNTEYKDHYIVAYDKKILHAISVKNITSNWVIIVHGYDSEALNMACYAKNFYNMGYSVLLIDQRGFGLSEGNETTMGNKEKLDLLKWVDHLNNNGAEKIILFGVSMGASTVMLASNKISANVRLIIEDCGYTSAWNEFYLKAKELKLPGTDLLMETVNKINIKKAGYDFKDASPVKAIKKAKVPMLFVHGSGDTFVPFFMLSELYDAYGGPYKDFLVVEGAGHARCSVYGWDAYEKKLDKFLDKFIFSEVNA